MSWGNKLPPRFQITSPLNYPLWYKASEIPWPIFPYINKGKKPSRFYLRMVLKTDCLKISLLHLRDLFLNKPIVESYHKISFNRSCLSEIINFLKWKQEIFATSAFRFYTRFLKTFVFKTNAKLLNNRLLLFSIVVFDIDSCEHLLLPIT